MNPFKSVKSHSAGNEIIGFASIWRTTSLTVFSTSYKSKFLRQTLIFWSKNLFLSKPKLPDNVVSNSFVQSLWTSMNWQEEFSGSAFKGSESDLGSMESLSLFNNQISIGWKTVQSFGMLGSLHARRWYLKVFPSCPLVVKLLLNKFLQWWQCKWYALSFLLHRRIFLVCQSLLVYHVWKGLNIFKGFLT